jgi:hypothetical protein
LKTSTISSRMICNRGTAIFCSRLLLGTVLLLNAACTILNYHPTTPITKLPVENHDRREFLSYSYISGFPIDSNEQKIPWPSQLLKESLEKHTRFIKVIITPSPPASGVHVNVYQTDGSPPSTWCRVSNWTLTIIPCYTEGIALYNHFDVYVDNTLKQDYRYSISRTGIWWIGVLPFFWINLFTADYKEAFLNNIYQFITEATRDEVL